MTEQNHRPFHETIIDAIERCPSPSTGEIIRLHRLIIDTVIPENHDAILEALRKYWDFQGSNKWAHEITEVAESLRAQKRQAEEKNKS
ncbi:MAG: hypothetical protein M1324_03215 [Patescibacteria group bacterium]|nr:hypothetical protein [Patescibacteria group bacterium]